MVGSQKAFHIALLFVVMYFGVPKRVCADSVTFATADFDCLSTIRATFAPPPITLATSNFTLQDGFQLGSAQLSRTFDDGINRPVKPSNAQSAPRTEGLGNLIMTVISIPEPTTLVLFGTGLAALALRRRKSS